MSTKSTIKNENKYSCEKCDYFTSKKTDYSRHILTDKHKRNVLSTSVNNYSTIENDFTCDICNKKYKERTGLWRHKNKGKCKNDNIIKNDNIRVDKLHDKDQLIIMLIKENTEFKNIMIGKQNMMLEQQNIMIKLIETMGGAGDNNL
jgi:uncharacterized C2H2 Zn-finger protein